MAHSHSYNPITLYMDGRTPVQVDRDDFVVASLMMKEKLDGIHCYWPEAAKHVADELEKLGYDRMQANRIAVLAKNQPRFE